MGDLTRRTVLQALAAGATGVAVAGWSTAAGGWVPAGALDRGATGPAGPADLAAVPPLDGTLETSPGSLAAFAGDFGRLVTGTPAAVLRPGSVADVARMVRFARRHGLTVAMNGQSLTPGLAESHSNFGQALAPGGIAVDARRLATIHSLAGGVADVDAGVTWGQLTDAAFAEGRTPPMLTDFLGLSVGGTLSVGGIGGTMQRAGAQVDTVRSLDVVTGRGDVVTCSRRRHPLLFDAVLAGAGQCGLIVRARVELAPAPAQALVVNLFYDDLGAYVADQLRVLRDGRFTYQEGQIVRRPDDTGWRYLLEGAVYFSPPAGPPDVERLLAGLADDRPAAVTQVVPYPVWAHRIDPAVDALTAAGFWATAHPWLSVFVPASRTVEYVGGVVAELAPGDLGAGLATFFPFRTSVLRRPQFVVPRGERAAFALTLLRFPFPGQPVDGLVAQNRRFFDAAVAVGGKRYIIGAVPDMSPADWRRHYGRLWPHFAALKHLFDPDGVLTPGQGIFG
jgi:FAD/FMN-containing dehydrogenase